MQKVVIFRDEHIKCKQQEEKAEHLQLDFEAGKIYEFGLVLKDAGFLQKNMAGCILK